MSAASDKQHAMKSRKANIVLIEGDLKKLKVALPEPLEPNDLCYPSYALRESVSRTAVNEGSFDIYLVQFRGERAPEWVIATLRIGSGARFNAADRTYGVRIKTGSLCRVGKGPHVLATKRVYVRANREKAMEKLLALYLKGATEAGQVRDRISSRRAQGQLMRAEGRLSWRWDS